MSYVPGEKTQICRETSVEDNGSSLTWVELDADQMKGATDTGESDLPTEFPRTSDVTLVSSSCGDKLCHPVSFAEGTGAPAIDELIWAAESNVFTRTDVTESEELWIVIFRFISQKPTAKSCLTVLRLSISHHIGLELETLL